MGKTLYVYVQSEKTWFSTVDGILFSDFFHTDLPVQIVQESSADKLTEFLARRKITKLTFGALSGFLQGRYQLGHLLEKMAGQYDHVIVLFLNFNFASVRYPAEVLQGYRKRWPNIRYVLCYLDLIEYGCSRYANYLRERSVFDAVYTFDQTDAQKYNLIFWRTPYSSISELQCVQPKKDVYFTGTSGGRCTSLHAIFQYGVKHGADIEMDLLLTSPDDVTDFSQSTAKYRLHPYSDIVPYRAVLEKTLEARCILDVVRPNQMGLSLRAYEAVVYNRKLLTNNPSILTFPFYDPRYMRCFETVEDIDWDWVKEDIPVDYHYNGEFSPINLLRDAEKRFWGSDDDTGSVSQ